MAEDLQYRLYNATINPPVDAWPGIAGLLDAEAQQRLSLKLQEVTLEPPSFIWQNIVNELDGVATIPVVPITRHWRKFAVAAIVIGVIALTAFYFISGYNDSNVPSQATAVTPRQTKPVRTDTIQAIDQVVARPQPRNNRPIILNASLGFAGKPSRKPSMRYASMKNALRVAAAKVNIDGAIGQSISPQSDHYVPRKDYLTIAAPNGQPARISAKFIDAVNYVIMDEPAQNLDGALRSISWKRRFQNWSNKLMNTPAFMPAATNFMDIVELEELLKEQ